MSPDDSGGLNQLCRYGYFASAGDRRAAIDDDGLSVVNEPAFEAR